MVETVESAPSSHIVDAWTVVDGNQAAFSEGLLRLFARLRVLDGFIEAQILQGIDPTRFLSWARWQTPAERARATNDAEVLRIVRELTALAHSHPHSYGVIQVFTAPDRPG